MTACKTTDDKSSHKEDHQPLEQDLDQVYLSNINRERSEHRARVANYIRDRADRVEILILKNLVVEPDPDDPLNLKQKAADYESFQVVPYEHSVKVVSSITITDNVSNASSLISDIILSASDGSVFSHKPSFGILVYSQGTLIFSTSISSYTSNFYFMYPTGGKVDSVWYGIGDRELEKFGAFVKTLIKNNSG